ncbi:MAG: glycosyltransferase, partial [Candidatus Kapabacteria bacterium]|nr:glycosyltransferase [Candidatus Kapabacteria bacterium]MDW8224823.1 glycosyltransferase [Bacteroidota bacterium]
MNADTTLTQPAEFAAPLAEPPAIELSVVIVSHNVAELLRQCLHSVEQALEGIVGEIIVVDNASEDGTVDRL